VQIYRKAIQIKVAKHNKNIYMSGSAKSQRAPTYCHNSGLIYSFQRYSNP